MTPAILSRQAMQFEIIKSLAKYGPTAVIAGFLVWTQTQQMSQYLESIYEASLESVRVQKEISSALDEHNELMLEILRPLRAVSATQPK